MKKYDLVLIAVVLLAAAIFLGNRIITDNQGSHLYAQVVMGREVIDELPLDTPIVKTYKTDEGYNTIVIEAGKCQISEADCFNQICVNSSSISKAGESIVCMPHKIAVTLVEGE